MKLIRSSTHLFPLTGLVSLVLALGLLGSSFGIADAHANLVRSEPAANAVLDVSPAELRLWFSEAPEPRFSEVQIHDRSGQVLNVVGPLQPDPSDPTLLAASLQSLAPGVYTVVWRSTSAVDGHVTGGAFAFVVGQDQVPAGGLGGTSANAAPPQSSGPTPTSVVVRWLSYLALALLVGGFGFTPLVIAPALPSTRRRGKGRARRPSGKEVESQSLSSPLGSALSPVLVAGWSLAVAASLLGAVVQAEVSADVGLTAALTSALGTLLGGTRYGMLFWVRLGLLLLIGLLLLGGRLRRARPLPKWWHFVGLSLAAVAALTISLGSHAAPGDDALPNTFADLLHLLAMGVWVGGLVTLLLVLLSHSRAQVIGAVGVDPGVLTVPGLVGSFSRLATVAIVVLGLTGVYQAVVEVADPANLLDTSYGQALLVKLGLAVPLLGLGALNHFLIRRRLAAEGAKPGVPFPQARLWHRRLLQAVSGEVILVSAVLMTTAVLTSLPPAKEAFGPGVVFRGDGPDVHVVLVVNPDNVGQNTFDVYIRDSSGRPISDAEKVSITFGSLTMDMGATEAVALNEGGGRYSLQGTYLSMEGAWEAKLLVRRPGLDDVQIVLTLNPTVAPAAGLAASGGVSGSGPTLPQSIPSGLIIGIELVVVGVIPILSSPRLSRARPSVGYAAVVVGFAIVLLGIWVGTTALLAQAALPARDPVPADQASLARGEQVYSANCSVCHGASGLGDGPAAKGLQVPPANLRIHMAMGHTDSQLYDYVTNGIAPSMPAWKGRLTEQETWDAINYIRTFASRATLSATSPPGASPSIGTGASGVASTPQVTAGFQVLPPDVVAAGLVAIVWQGEIWASDEVGAFHRLVGETAESAYPSEPAWQPGTEELAYTLQRWLKSTPTTLKPTGVTIYSDVWLTNRQGNSRILVEHDGEGVTITSPYWQADGKAIYYVRTAEAQSDGKSAASAQRIERLVLATGERNTIQDQADSPAISPDGRLLAYVQIVSGLRSLWVKDLGSGRAWRISDARFVNATRAAFSPDSRQIAFGGALLPQAADSAPSGVSNPLAPIADWLAPRALAHGIPYGLYVSDVDGSTLRRVGTLSFDDPAISWPTGGQGLLVYDATGLYWVDPVTASQTTLLASGSSGGFDWLPRK